MLPTLSTAKPAIIAVLIWTAAPGWAETCSPSRPEEFNAFFARFSTDQAFSVERTQFPLPTAHWEYGRDDAGVDGSAPVWKRISKDDFLQWKTIATYQRQEGLNVRTTMPSTDTMQVTVFREGSDMEMRYKFSGRAGCWRFVEFVDRSL
ncbi:hypothetical protein ACTJKJ_02295 [Roseateles sp. 22389]|uniref:hypothetical protein n=1 Tax=Roseateles sp. 22389 TaxID=3453916 RepID=UPI002603DC0F|nr:hypothetical protein [uncultured Roseateles sp.]